MARIWRHCRALAAAFAALACVSLAPAAADDQGPSGGTDLYDRPVLAVDPGMHTGTIWAQAVDWDGRFAVTGGADRAVRIWSVKDGKLLRTIWIPVGPDPVGEIHAVAISPDGSTVAAGGWTETISGDSPIYVFDRESGALIRRLGGLLHTVKFLTFSPDGRYLAATLHSSGLRVFDSNKHWGLALRDAAYGDQSYGASFAPGGQLATTSLDGKIRLYRYDPDTPNPNFRQAGQRVESPSGGKPFGIAFSPDGRRLAVAHFDVAAVDVLDATTLERVGEQTLFAAGAVTDAQGQSPLFAWDRGGLGAEQNTASGISALPDDRILIASMTPCLGLMDARGAPIWTVGQPVLDFRYQTDVMKVSPDGKIVDFGDRGSAGTLLRFDLRSLALSPAPSNDDATLPPNREGLTIVGWRDGTRPTLAGHSLPLRRAEASRSLRTPTASSSAHCGAKSNRQRQTARRGVASSRDRHRQIRQGRGRPPSRLRGRGRARRGECAAREPERARRASLYADVNAQYLPNDQASRTAILDALDAMEQAMRKSGADHDMAVIDRRPVLSHPL